MKKCDRNLQNSELIGSHSSVIHRLAVFQNKLISSSEAGRIKVRFSPFLTETKVWDLDSKERTLRIRPHGSVGAICDFAIEGHFIYFGCNTQNASPIYVFQFFACDLKKFDLETGDEVSRSTHKRSHIRTVEFIQLGTVRYLVVGSGSHGLEVGLPFLLPVSHSA